MRRGVVLATVAVGASWLASQAAAQTPPEMFVDEGACPFECCTYGTWKASVDIPAYASSDKEAPTIGVIPAGANIEAVTGQVRTRGVPFLVTQAHDDAIPGERFLVYTYQGEGVFRIWRKGQWQEWELGFSPYGGTPGTRCEQVGGGCFGHLERELQSDWWVQVHLPDGGKAWVNGHAGFEGQDACGG